MKTAKKLLEEANKMIDYNLPVMKKVEVSDMKPLGFFPGGRGTFDNEENIDEKEIMIVGNDFGTVEYFNNLRKNGENEKTNTWKNLLDLLEEIEKTEKIAIVKNCFFTNAFMGLRIGKNMLGECPGSYNPKFIEQCQKFFFVQLNSLPKLKLVIVLGLQVPKLLHLAIHEAKGNIFNDLGIWTKTFKNLDDKGGQIISTIHHPLTGKKLVFTIITHPSYAQINWKKDKGRSRPAEIEILKVAMREAGLYK